MLYRWSALSKLQLGNLGEQLFRSQFAMCGFDVFVPDVDEKGIDFLVRSADDRFFEIQVKSIRDEGYIYLAKDRAPLVENRLIGIVRFIDHAAPNLFIIPSMAWSAPDDVFVSRDYEGKKSKPEWGVTVSEKTIDRLRKYSVENYMDRLGRPQLS